MKESTKKLVNALTKAGAPSKLIERAAQDYYHDFFSSLTTPQLALHHELVSLGLTNLAKRVVAGDFDATKAESEEWAMSPEGQACFKQLDD